MEIFCMHIFQGVYANVPEQHIRTVYDEMTTDTPALEILPESSPEPEAEKQPAAMSPTGFPLDELRYENWKTINELLFDARLHDQQYMDTVDESIKLGTPPPSRDMELSNVPKLAEFAGLSDPTSKHANDRQDTLNDKQVTLDEFREKIYELRGRKA
ncbi:hypothetical protein JADG_006562 [Aureobasidium aubasidani]|nr:hypothetical protein JADG_006562 [Aureobasidium pullulans]